MGTRGGWQSGQDFPAAVGPTPHRSALSWIHRAEHIHCTCAVCSEGQRNAHIPGWKQLQKLCQLHSDVPPAWALGPAVLTDSTFKSSCASFLGQYTEMPFHGKVRTV